MAGEKILKRPRGRMKFLRLMLVVFAIAFSASSNAVVARGARSCQIWAKDRAENSILGVADETWLVGYLSGLAYGSNIDVLQAADNDSIFLWMDEYCKSHPLGNMTGGANRLFSQLKKKIH
ncbi:MAG: hypothetical protein ACLQHK_08790 [Gallionellaceae bacterium]